MKYNLRPNKTIQHFGIVLFILVFAFTSIGASSQTNIEQKTVTQIAISNYLKAQKNSDLSDEEKIKASIEAYFTTRYEGQKLLKAQDFSVIVEDDSLDWVKKEKDKREIELYIASSFDLGYQSYKFNLDYDSIEIKKNKAVVQLRQSHQVVYEAIAPEISGLTDLLHTITLHTKNGIWVIYKDEYQDEYTKLLDSIPKDKIKQQIDENHKNSQGSSSTMYGAKVHAGLAFSPLALNFYPYNRSATQTFSFNNAYATQGAPIPQAIKNAYQKANGVPYPSTWPTKYKREIPSEGDCTNFVSQSIFEGTGYASGDRDNFYPAGDDDNWYYRFSPTAGGSTTWRNVGSLYNYLLNTSTPKRGPYGTAASSCCFCSSLNPGDAIFMKSGADWQHAVIVYSKSSPCYSPNNILVNSHDSNKQNEPLPYWSGFSWYGVSIQGYNAYTFIDVLPSYWPWENVERLYKSGITGGCSTNPMQYCPGNTVTRAQMAVFLLKGKYGSSYTPPAVGSSTGFNDVPIGDWAAAWIKQLAAENITAGCGSGNYCPEGTVTHAQMAIFLLRSKYGSSYNPPVVGSSTGFNDVPIDHWAAAWIKQINVEGISNGAHACSVVNYCPEVPVTRAEMAGMLVQTFNLP